MPSLLLQPETRKRKIPRTWETEERWLFYPDCALRMRYDPYCGSDGEFTQWIYGADVICAVGNLQGRDLIAELGKTVRPTQITCYSQPDFNEATIAFRQASPMSVSEAAHNLRRYLTKQKEGT